MEVPTMQINVDGHPVVINASEFDESTMQRWEEPSTDAPSMPASESAPMAMSEPPVMVKIKADDTALGYTLIPSDQYDPNTMQLWEEPPSATVNPATSEPTAGEMGESVRRGRRGA